MSLDFTVPGDTGYSRSTGAKGAGGGDIFDRARFRDMLGMDETGRTYGRQDYLTMLQAGPSPVVQDQYETVPDAINPHEQPQTFMQSLIAGNTRENTLMETMFPEKSKAGAYTASISGGAESLKRDASQVVTDGVKVSEKRMGAQADVQEAKQNFQADWSAARNEALAAFQEVTQEMGIDPSVAAESMISDDAPGKASAVAYMASEAAFGAGTMATMGKAAYVNMELSEQERGLTQQQQEQILEAMLQRLQSPPQNDTRADASMSGGGEAPEAPEASGADWAAMEIDDIAELLEADPNGEDQPEMQDLMDMECQLCEVEDNHIYVAEHYADNITYAKMENSAQSGNEAMRTIIDEASVVDAPDSLKASLAGDSMSQLSGVQVTAADIGFDAKQVSSHFDASLVNEPDVQRLLQGDMDQQFTFARGY